MPISTPRLLVALAAAAAAVAVVVGLVVLAQGDDEPPAAAQSAVASPGSSADPAPPSEAPANLAEAFADIEADVREIRQLEAPDIEPAEIIDREQLARELDELLDEQWTEEELFRSNMTLRAMGLLTADQDVRELNEQLLSEQVIGFYDPAEQRMVVVSDEGLTPLARVTYAHEYTHALQDAAFDTFEVRDALTDDDAILARQALEEGDATLVMVQWAYQGNLTPDEISEVATHPVPDMSGIPDWMVAQLAFPYDRGFAFVTSLRAGSGWEAIDAAYTDAPASTEQIIHPEKYLAGEEPVRVEAPALADVFGRRWRDLEPTTMGEAMIDIWLTQLGADDATADAAAAGWGGDRLAVATAADDAWVMGWRMAWDTEADADEFEAAYEGLQPAGGIASDVLRPSPTETLVLHASGADLLRAARSRLQR